MIKIENYSRRIFEEIGNVLLAKFPGFQDDPFYIKWGALSIDENRERGGSPTSKHLTGDAIDVQLTPNTDARKVLYAIIAEYVMVKNGLGSEIAIEWGLNGHVHTALVRYRGMHKRFPINNGELWTSNSKISVLSVNKAIKKYGSNVVDESSMTRPIDFKKKLTKLSNDIESSMETMDMGNVDLVIYRAGALSRNLSLLNTSPVINQDLHELIDRIKNQRIT